MLADLPVWERRWAPYDEDTYDQVVALVPPGSIVVDIGAGDLRLARRLAARARMVYAIENQPALLTAARVPANVRVICGDARTLPFPTGIDAAVLLMRHCTHFPLYREKLLRAGGRYFITNARWGMAVECIDLALPARPFEEMPLGWYACRCGATGFRPGPPEKLTTAVMETIIEVSQCQECEHYGWNSRRFS